jgi:hypothetical protein
LAGFSLADELITRPPQSDPRIPHLVASIVGGDDAVVVDMKTSLGFGLHRLTDTAADPKLLRAICG